MKNIFSKFVFDSKAVEQEHFDAIIFSQPLVIITPPFMIMLMVSLFQIHGGISNNTALNEVKGHLGTKGGCNSFPFAMEH